MICCRCCCCWTSWSKIADPDTCCIKIIHWGKVDGPLEPSIPFLPLPLGMKSLGSSGKWVNSGCRTFLKPVSYPFILPREVLWRWLSFMSWWWVFLCKVRIRLQKYYVKSLLQSSRQLFDKKTRTTFAYCLHKSWSGFRTGTLLVSLLNINRNSDQPSVQRVPAETISSALLPRPSYICLFLFIDKTNSKLPVCTRPSGDPVSIRFIIKTSPVV